MKSINYNFRFFIGREIPKEIFGLVVSSCGGQFGDESDNSAFSVDDPSITHYIVDRPAENMTFKKNKEYVQPQWVFDSVNTMTLLPISDYSPGKKLPPHLSPFFDYNGEDYKPKKYSDVVNNAEEELKLKEATTAANA